MTDDNLAIWQPSPFFFPNREGRKPERLVIHKTAGGATAQAIAAWFSDSRAQVSTHYVVGLDGTLIQVVREADAAWANGALTAGHDAFWDPNINPNDVTISIEFVDPASTNDTPLTDAQKTVGFPLIHRICQRNNIPLDSTHIVGHCSIDPVNRKDCPNAFPWSELWAYLEGYIEMIPQGWHDDGKTLTAPNGVPVHTGFRSWILSHAWNPDNWPLAAEQGTAQLEASNPSLGGGTQQIFRLSMLGWTASRGVFEEWLGQELLYVRQHASK